MTTKRSQRVPEPVLMTKNPTSNKVCNHPILDPHDGADMMVG